MELTDRNLLAEPRQQARREIRESAAPGPFAELETQFKNQLQPVEDRLPGLDVLEARVLAFEQQS